VKLWESRGYNVQFIEGIERAENEERRQIQEQLAIAKASEFAQLETSEMTVTEARSVLEELDATREERNLAHKRLLQDKLPGVNLNDPEFVLKVLVQNNGRFLRTAELLWIARNPEVAKWLDRWTWTKEFNQATRRGQFVSYTRLSWRSAQAKLLHECPLHPFMDGKIEQWDNKSPGAIAVHQWAVLHRRQLHRYLRLNISEDHSPVTTVNKLLRKLGYTVKFQGWKGSEKDRERQYSIVNREDADRDAILNALNERFIKHLEQKEGIAAPATSAPMITTCLNTSSPSTCDHPEEPEGANKPPKELETWEIAWMNAKDEHQRQTILDAFQEYMRHIA
jgi:hypothetical protein